MKPADRFIFILLRGRIVIPPKMKEWFIANLPDTDEEFQRHHAELERGKGFYMNLLSDYRRYNCKSELKDVVKFFMDNVRGKLDDSKDTQFYSVVLKICLDLIVADHSRNTHRVNTIVY